MDRHHLLLLAILSLPLTCGGATCRNWSQPVVPTAPVAFLAPPTLDEALAVVNENSRRIQQFQTDSAILTVAGVPAKLQASIALQQPRRFRLKGRVFAPEVDLGSNDELFWFWAKSAPENAIFYARHSEYMQSRASQPFPVEPQWIIEAFGLIHLDPQALHEGPYPRGEGRFEIRSHLPAVAGRLVRVLVIDETYGWIVEQTLIDSRGQVLAQVSASDHHYDHASGGSLPRQVSIELPQSQLELRINVASYAVNQLYGDPSELWSPPSIDGYEMVDLTRGRLGPPSQLPGSSVVPTHPHGYPDTRSGFRPSYRGYSAVR